MQSGILSLGNLDPLITTRDITAKKNLLKKLKYDLGMPYISQLRQAHTSICKYIEKGSLFTYIGDAQWTDVPDILLTVGVADCIPILFWTTGESPIIGTIHAGRKGITKNIIKKTFLKLKKKGYHAEHIYIHIGPCICQQCFTFGKDKKNPYKEGFSEIYTPYIRNNTEGTRNIDLRGIAYQQLLDADIHANHITQDTRCTVEDVSFCSWRRDGIKGKNNYLWIRNT